MQVLAYASLAVVAAGLFGLLREAWKAADPVERETVVRVEPDSRYLDRSHIQVFTVWREVCSRRNQRVEVLRGWAEAGLSSGAGAAPPVPVVAALEYDLRRGCEVVEVRQPIPENLKPGRYNYSATLRACSAFGRCALRRLGTVPVTVVGGTAWPDYDVPLPPPLETGRH